MCLRTDVDVIIVGTMPCRPIHACIVQAVRKQRTLRAGHTSVPGPACPVAYTPAHRNRSQNSPLDRTVVVEPSAVAPDTAQSATTQADDTFLNVMGPPEAFLNLFQW